MQCFQRNDKEWKARSRKVITVRGSGFTIIELLVVLLIMLILIAVTVASFNFSFNADRVRAGARQIQSFLAGARDKAIYAKEIRGVRLLLDPNDNHCVNAVQYIGSPQRETGTLTVDAATGLYVTQAGGTPWGSLIRRGYLTTGCQIQIPSNTGPWYTVAGVNMAAGTLSLNRPVIDYQGSSAQFGFVLQLAPGVLGDAQPVLLPRGVVVDLDGSRLPPAWLPISFAGSYSPQMDVLFTPRGTVVGGALGAGIIHLHLADAGDVVTWKTIAGRNSTLFNPPVVPTNDPSSQTQIVKKDRILVTLSTRTGNASVHYVNTVPSATATIALDPYLFAETGQVANK